MTGELYREVISITEEYLGPAAERFVARQITFHLGKKPQDLSPNDLPTFIEWTKVTFGLLTENQWLIDEYITRIKKLEKEVIHE